MNKGSSSIRVALLGAAVLLLAATLAACSSSQLGNEEKAPLHMVLVAPVHANEQGDAMRLGAAAAGKEFGVELEYIAFEPSDDAKEQLEAALGAVDKGVSAVLIDPADEMVLRELTAVTSSKEVPVVTLNDERIAKGEMAAISMDNREAGRQAGQAMAELLGGSGTVAIIQSDRDDPDLSQREAGIREELAGYEAIHITDSAACGNLRDACWQAAKQLLDRVQVDGIVALEAQASLGLTDELERRKQQGEIRVVSFGSETEQLELLQDGVIHKLVVQNGFSTGYLGVKQAVALLAGERVDKSVLLETKVVDADNMFWMTNQKMLFPFVQ